MILMLYILAGFEQRKKKIMFVKKERNNMKNLGDFIKSGKVNWDDNNNFCFVKGNETWVVRCFVSDGKPFNDFVVDFLACQAVDTLEIADLSKCLICTWKNAALAVFTPVNEPLNISKRDVWRNYKIVSSIEWTKDMYNDAVALKKRAAEMSLLKHVL
jgi:hypothetical protein